MTFSFTSDWNLFQLLQPIGGVSEVPLLRRLTDCPETDDVKANPAMNTKAIVNDKTRPVLLLPNPDTPPILINGLLYLDTLFPGIIAGKVIGGDLIGQFAFFIADRF